MNIIDKAFNEEWISSDELRAFAEEYQKEFGRVKQGLIGAGIGGALYGAAGKLDFGTKGAILGGLGGAALGAAAGAATRKYQVVFLDRDGKVDGKVVQSRSKKQLCKAISEFYHESSHIEAFKYPEEKKQAEEYISQLKQLKGG